jgi:hypothetical protein
MRRVALFLWLACFLILPFVFWPWASFAYEVPRVWFVLRCIEVLVAVRLVLLLRQKDWPKVDSKLFAGVMSLGLVAVVSSVTNGSQLESWWGNAYRMDGLVALLHLITLSCMIMVSPMSSWVKPTLRVASFSATLMGFLAILEFLQTSIGITSNGVLSWEVAGFTFQQPNFLAGFLFVLLPVCFWELTQANTWFSRIWWGVHVLLQVLTIVLTQSLGAIFGIPVLLWAWFCITRKSWKMLTMSLIGAIVLFWVSAMWYQQSFLTYEGRDRILSRLVQATVQKPVLGWGWARVAVAFEAGKDPWPGTIDIYLDKAHSVFLEMAVTTGLLGLGIYLVLAARMGKRLQGSPLLLLVLFAYLYHSQTNVISIAEEIWFWVLLGWAGSQTSKQVID